MQVTEGDGYCLGRVLINAQIAAPLFYSRATANLSKKDSLHMIDEESFVQAMLVTAAVRLRGVAIMKITLSAGLVAVLLSPFAGAARADTTVLFDNTFNDTTQAPVFTQSAGGTSVLRYAWDCGNPGAAIQGMFNFPIGATGPFSSSTGMLDNLLSYNPALQGAITSITATADKNVTVTGVTGFQANGFNLLIEQDGTFYRASGNQIPFTCMSIGCSSGFLAASTPVLTASDFSLYDFSTNTSNSSVHPNFAGDAITFGVFFANGSNIVAGTSVTAVYDNLRLHDPICPGPNRWCRPPRPDLSERWPSRLVATTAEDRLMLNRCVC